MESPFAFFKEAKLPEFKSTFFSINHDLNTKLRWTPIFQNKKPSKKFVEHLMDCSFKNEFNVFSKYSNQNSINKLVESFIQEAFIQENEISESNKIQNEDLSFHKDLYFPPTNKTMLHGDVDFLIKNNQTNEWLAIMVQHEIDTYSYEFGYFDISPACPPCLFHYFNVNYNILENLKIITTNGHSWKLHAMNDLSGYQISKNLRSDDEVIFRDEEKIAAALGMMRFGLGLNSIEQKIIQELYLLYDEKNDKREN